MPKALYCGNQEIIVKEPRIIIQETKILTRNLGNSSISPSWDPKVFRQVVCFDALGNLRRVPPVADNYCIDFYAALG
ncbi:hypothetical protein RN04_08065 [Arthrobacter sp. W1]|nr:hypothetical protein RN04_08065 [Arthrobacter sp. W1]